MSGELTSFSFAFAQADHPIRVVTIEGDPWFVAADVCRALGLLPGADGGFQRHLSKLGSEWCNHPIPTNPNGGGMKRFGVISEPGLYRLVLRSDKPQARPFQDWVTRVVLPAIRKDGAYVMGEETVGQPGGLSEDEFVLKAITILQAKVERLREDNAKLVSENSALAPKAAIVEDAFARRNLLTISQFGRKLEGVNIIQLKRDLKRLGYLYQPRGSGTYRVYAQFRHTLFCEKLDDYGSCTILPMVAGMACMTKHYRRGDLTLKGRAAH